MTGRKMTVGIIVGNRNFFPALLAKAGREDIIRLLAEKGYDAVVLTPEDTRFRRGRDTRGRQEMRCAVPRQPRPHRRRDRHPAELRRRTRDRQHAALRRPRRAGADPADARRGRQDDDPIPAGQLLRQDVGL